jgi:hypothetical protein
MRALCLRDDDVTIWNCWLCYPGLCVARNDATHIAERVKQLRQMTRRCPDCNQALNEHDDHGCPTYFADQSPSAGGPQHG